MKAFSHQGGVQHLRRHGAALSRHPLLCLLLLLLLMVGAAVTEDIHETCSSTLCILL